VQAPRPRRDRPVRHAACRHRVRPRADHAHAAVCMIKSTSCLHREPQTHGVDMTMHFGVQTYRTDRCAGAPSPTWATRARGPGGWRVHPRRRRPRACRGWPGGQNYRTPWPVWQPSPTGGHARSPGDRCCWVPTRLAVVPFHPRGVGTQRRLGIRPRHMIVGSGDHHAEGWAVIVPSGTPARSPRPWCAARIDHLGAQAGPGDTTMITNYGWGVSAPRSGGRRRGIRSAGPIRSRR
jgi:hypothetical protein